MISKFERQNLNNAGLKKSQTMKLGDFVYLLNSRFCSPSHSLHALMQGVLNIHALIEGHTRFETKKVRLKQTINLCFRKNIHIR